MPDFGRGRGGCSAHYGGGAERQVTVSEQCRNERANSPSVPQDVDFASSVLALHTSYRKIL
jgi:hypothetical protein